MYNVDIALQQVKIAEGALAPVLAAVGNVQKNFGNVQSLAVLETLQARIAAQPHGADLSGRSRILRHPASQGDAGAAAPRSRHCARPGAGHGGPRPGVTPPNRR